MTAGSKMFEGFCEAAELEDVAIDEDENAGVKELGPTVLTVPVLVDEVIGEDEGARGIVASIITRPHGGASSSGPLQHPGSPV